MRSNCQVSQLKFFQSTSYKNLASKKNETSDREVTQFIDHKLKEYADAPFNPRDSDILTTLFEWACEDKQRAAVEEIDEFNKIVSLGKKNSSSDMLEIIDAIKTNLKEKNTYENRIERIALYQMLIKKNVQEFIEKVPNNYREQISLALQAAAASTLNTGDATNFLQTFNRLWMDYDPKKIKDSLCAYILPDALKMGTGFGIFLGMMFCVSLSPGVVAVGAGVGFFYGFKAVADPWDGVNDNHVSYKNKLKEAAKEKACRQQVASHIPMLETSIIAMNLIEDAARHLSTKQLEKDVAETMLRLAEHRNEMRNRLP